VAAALCERVQLPEERDVQRAVLVERVPMFTSTVCGGVGRTVAAVPQSTATETVTAVYPSSGTPRVREHCGVSRTRRAP
jgi:hypothetical protein